MKRNFQGIKKFYTFGLICMMLFSFSAASGETPGKEELLQKKQKELSTVKKKESSAKQQLNNIMNKLEAVENNLAGYNSSIKKSQKNLAVLKQKISEKQKEIAILDMQADTKQKLLDKRLVSIYKYGFYSYLEAFLSAKSFSDFAARFELVGYLIQQDMELLEKTRGMINDLNYQKKMIEKQHAQLNSEKARLEALQKKTRQKERELLSLQKQQQRLINQYESERRRIERELLEIEKEFEQYIRNAEKRKSDIISSGTFMYPVSARISSYFDLKRRHPILKTIRPHKGIDFAAPYGTAVRASDGGEVVLAGRKGNYGYTVILYHGNGFSTLYAHNSKLLVTTGQKVVKGEIISRVGSTGLSTGPHLHFEIWKNGVAVDPLLYLTK